MKTLALFLALITCSASATELVDIHDGPALAAYLRQLGPQEDAQFEGVLTIRRKPEGTLVVPFVSRTRVQADTWEVTYETSRTRAVPAQRLTVIHFPDRPNRYLFAKASDPDAPLGEAKPINGKEIYLHFASSDFWVVDLGLDFFHWPTQNLIKAEMRSGRPCKVLESIPGPDQRGAYGKVLTWIDNEGGGIVRAEAYDQQGKRIKEFEVKSFKKLNGQWQLQETRIMDLPANSRTSLHFNLESEK